MSESGRRTSRPLEVRRMFEPNRLAVACLANAYAYVVPHHARTISRTRSVRRLDESLQKKEDVLGETGP